MSSFPVVCVSRLRAIALAGLLACPWGAAGAATLDEAKRAYLVGNFTEAAAAGEAAGTPEALSMAARAWLAHCMTDAAPAEMFDAAMRAESAARAALARDPASVEARLQLAVAVGVKGRLSTPLTAVREGYAREGRKLLEQAIAAAPEEAWAHALLGAWHLEVLRRGGRAGAALYGARLQEGIDAFERARALGPEDPAIALLFAVALLELDADRHAARAAAELDAAASAPATDAFERDMREQARALVAVLASEGPRAAAALASARFG